MKNKNIRQLYYSRLIRAIYINASAHIRANIAVSLLIVLMGIFLCPKIAYLSPISAEKIIELTNEQRIKNNLSKITVNQLLAKAAHEKGKAIMENQSFQHHFNGRKFSDWIREAGYEYSYVGENLALDFITSEGAIDAWLASPTHKKNILNEKFAEIGVAVIEGKFQGDNSILIVQIFGTPQAIKSAATVATKVHVINNQNIKLASSLKADKAALTVFYKNNQSINGRIAGEDELMSLKISNPQNFLNSPPQYSINGNIFTYPASALQNNINISRPAQINKLSLNNIIINTAHILFLIIICFFIILSILISKTNFIALIAKAEKILLPLK